MKYQIEVTCCDDSRTFGASGRIYCLLFEDESDARACVQEILDAQEKHQESNRNQVQCFGHDAGEDWLDARAIRAVCFVDTTKLDAHQLERNAPFRARDIELMAATFRSAFKEIAANAD
ncbi:MAG: hypothetical protein VW683_16555 [Betaproteobacteria bacterium]